MTQPTAAPTQPPPEHPGGRNLISTPRRFLDLSPEDYVLWASLAESTRRQLVTLSSIQELLRFTRSSYPGPFETELAAIEQLMKECLEKTKSVADDLCRLTQNDWDQKNVYQVVRVPLLLNPRVQVRENLFPVREYQVAPLGSLQAAIRAARRF